MIKKLYDPTKLYQVPDKIYFAYFSKSNGEPLFHALQIDGQEIPIFRFVLYSTIFKTKSKKMHLSEYAKGFLEGVKYQFVPTIDTPENKRELILNEVENGSQFGFTQRKKDNKSSQWYFDKKDTYEYGFRVGKVYKAWSIIFETPKYFENGFPDITKNENVNADTNKGNNETVADELHNTVEKYFLPLQDAFRIDTDYKKAFETVYSYFKQDIKKLSKPIFVRSGNVKKLCKALGGIHRDTIGEEIISIKYLEFSKATFTCLSNQKIEKDKITRSTFYKYFKGKL